MYDCMTLMSMAPSAAIRQPHYLIFKLVGIEHESRATGTVHLYTKKEVGTIDLDIEKYASSDFEQSWRRLLESAELQIHQDDPVVIELRSALRDRGMIPWQDVVQLVLADMPVESVRHLDFSGARWRDNGGPGEFGGYAMRITREMIYVQPTATEYFANLTAAGELAIKLSELPPRDRVDAVLEQVLGEGETSLGEALRTAFPEATSGDLAPGDDFAARDGLRVMVERWIGWNVPQADDGPEPEAPGP